MGIGKNGAIPEPEDCQYTHPPFVRCEVPRSLNCENFSIFPAGGVLKGSRYGNVRSTVRIIYEGGHI